MNILFIRTESRLYIVFDIMIQWSATFLSLLYTLCLKNFSKELPIELYTKITRKNIELSMFISLCICGLLTYKVMSDLSIGLEFIFSRG